MFSYDTASEHPRSYRPDLHNVITRWLACVPAEAWQYCVKFEVGEVGELVVHFMKAASQGGPLRLITVVVDGKSTTVITDTDTWYYPRPEVISMRVLNRAADTI